MMKRKRIVLTAAAAAALIAILGCEGLLSQNQDDPNNSRKDTTGENQPAVEWPGDDGAEHTLSKPLAVKVSPGIRYVEVSWEAVTGAEFYEVYYGAPAPEGPAAVKLATDPEGTAVTITGLADSTVYQVRVRAKDAGGGTSPLSGTVTSRKTSDPVNPFWYTGDFDYWESETDGYIITETAMLYNTMAPWAANGLIGGFKYEADIRYYVEFDNAEAAEKAPKTQRGKYQESLKGHPAGVFIIEYRAENMPADRPGTFLGVYFYGLGALQTNGTSALTVHHRNDRLAYLGNSIGLSQTQGGPQGVGQQWDPETATLAEAVELFTLENIHRFIAYVATPWYRLKGEFTNDSVNDEQWIKGGSYP
jgi:hypothetical protein